METSLLVFIHSNASRQGSGARNTHQPSRMTRERFTLSHNSPPRLKGGAGTTSGDPAKWERHGRPRRFVTANVAAVSLRW